MADLERIVVTHQHIDHGGGAHWIQQESGAEILCFRPLVDLIRNYGQACEDDDQFAIEVMAAHGVDDGVAGRLHAITQGAHVWAADIAGDAIALDDGDAVDFAERSWRALHRPGHSPSDLVFHDESSGELFSGDHLLSKTPSNPLVHKPLDGSTGRPRPLVEYVESLRRTRAMELEIVYGGHGEPLTDHVKAIDERLRAFDRRADKLAAALDRASNPVTAHQLARDLWGEVAVRQVYRLLSETLGHLDLLVADGRAVEHDDGDQIRFSSRA